MRIKEIHRKVYTAECSNRKTDILNTVGHVIQVLVTQLRIKEIEQKVNTAVCSNRKTENLNEEGHNIRV